MIYYQYNVQIMYAMYVCHVCCRCSGCPPYCHRNLDWKGPLQPSPPQLLLQPHPRLLGETIIIRGHPHGMWSLLLQPSATSSSSLMKCRSLRPPIQHGNSDLTAAARDIPPPAPACQSHPLL